MGVVPQPFQSLKDTDDTFSTISIGNVGIINQITLHLLFTYVVKFDLIKQNLTMLK